MFELLIVKFKVTTLSQPAILVKVWVAELLLIVIGNAVYPGCKLVAGDLRVCSSV